MDRDAIIARIAAERLRQLDLPGSELDVRNTPNDWAAIASHYLTEPVRRGINVPERDDFEDSFVKAAAVILAALEYTPVMEAMQHLKGNGEAATGFASVLERLKTRKQD